MYSHNIEPLVADLGDMLLRPTLTTSARYSIRILQYMLTVLISLRRGLHFKKSEIIGQQLSMEYFLLSLYYYWISAKKIIPWHSIIWIPTAKSRNSYIQCKQAFFQLATEQKYSCTCLHKYFWTVLNLQLYLSKRNSTCIVNITVISLRSTK